MLHNNTFLHNFRIFCKPCCQLEIYNIVVLKMVLSIIYTINKAFMEYHYYFFYLCSKILSLTTIVYVKWFPGIIVFMQCNLDISWRCAIRYILYEFFFLLLHQIKCFYLNNKNTYLTKYLDAIQTKLPAMFV